MIPSEENIGPFDTALKNVHVACHYLDDAVSGLRYDRHRRDTLKKLLKQIRKSSAAMSKELVAARSKQATKTKGRMRLVNGEAKHGQDARATKPRPIVRNTKRERP